MDIQVPNNRDELQAFGENTNLSFREKIQLLNERKRRSKSSFPVNFNKYSPWIFLMELSGVWYIGVVFALPYLYSDYNTWVLRGIQVLSNFIGIQILINWVCMVFVDSYYEPQIMNIPAEMRDLKPPVDYQQNTKTPNETNGLCQSVNRTRKYWAWTFCAQCQHMKPPRCHHCFLCQKCVLKRDHHCFFSRQCIGFRNFRFFCVLTTYCTIGTTFALLHALPYMYLEVFRPSNYFDILFPLTVFRWIFGYTDWRMVIIVPGMWALAIFTVYCWTISIGTWELVFNGKTMFEMENNIKIRDNRSNPEKLQAIFGYYWPINFLLPQYKYLPKEDPINWRSINVLE